MDIAQTKINEWIQSNDISKTLFLNSLNLTTLPDLPNNLIKLDCSFNKLTTLPILPNNLNHLDCGRNKLTTLPILPNNLIKLDCNSNKLTTLPILPNNLTTLDCYNNKLFNLPILPNTLKILNCYDNQLTILPELPNSLEFLKCYYNKLTNLPVLPNSLTELHCYDNQLTTLPVLPNNLNELYCYDNQLTILPVLPNSLEFLKCSYNKLTTLPNLPNNLTTLDCSNNKLTTLPDLPNTLYTLDCSNNELTTLPELPVNLQHLDCSCNEINNLDISNLQNLKYIDIAKNYLNLNNITVNDENIKNQIIKQIYFTYINLQKFNDFYNENINKCFITTTYPINYDNLNKWKNEILDEPNNIPFLLTNFVYAFTKTLTHISFKTFYDNACKLGYKIVELINSFKSLSMTSWNSRGIFKNNEDELTPNGVFKNKNIVIYNFDITISNNWVLLLIYKILYPTLIDTSNNTKIYIMDGSQMSDLNNKIKNPIVIYIDDCAYSGNQIINIRNSHLKNVKDIYICNVYITDYALKKFNVNKLNVIYIEKLNNFKDNLNESESNTYVKIVNNKYLNKLWLLDQCEGICNVYFDHKLASGASTFQSLLAFGLTPTQDINKRKFNNSYSLISGCESVYTTDKIKYINDNLFDLNESLNQKACPISFYKTIQYTYNNQIIKDFKDLYTSINNI